MGNKTIEVSGLCKSYGDKKLIDNYEYIFLKNDRIGIIGPNGCGKSTLLKMIYGNVEPDAGTIEIGQTIRMGYFSQENGGERRRLFLLRVLMSSPNVLILDEPTNDLDIQTLTILEDYLDRFDGIIIIVSHDRYFLDRTVNRIFSFEGNGVIRQFEGGYSDYLIRKELESPDRTLQVEKIIQNQMKMTIILQIRRTHGNVERKS